MYITKDGVDGVISLNCLVHSSVWWSLTLNFLLIFLDFVIIISLLILVLLLMWLILLIFVGGLVLKCYELRTRQHKMLMVRDLRPSKHYLP
jgi:hypothetical protein